MDEASDPFDDAVNHLNKLAAEERQNDIRVQTWSNALVNNWANEIHFISHHANTKLRPFNFQMTVRPNQGIGVKAGIDVLAFADGGGDGRGHQYPSLKLSLNHDGMAIISCKTDGESLIDECLSLDGPVPKQELRRLLALYAERVLERRIGPKSRK